MIGRPAMADHSSASRIACELRVLSPSSEKPIAPADAIGSKSARSSPARPAEIVPMG